MPDGTKKTGYVTAKTEQECEEKLAVMIAEMKAEAAAAKVRLEETKAR